MMTQTVLMVSSGFQAHKRGYNSVCNLLADRLEAAGITVLRTSDKLGRISQLADMISTVWQTRDQYQTVQIDVYSGLAFIWAELICVMARMMDKQVILTLHGGNLPSFAESWPRRVQRLLQMADVVTSPSAFLQEELFPLCEDIVLIPNPVDLDAFYFRTRETPQPRLIWLRSLHPIYNPLLAAHVTAQLSEDYPTVELYMIGPDKGLGTEESLKTEIKRLGIEERVVIVGGIPHSEVAKWLERADIFINTSDVDNMPSSLLEAMACGLCVVSTNVGGVPRLVEDGVNGILVPPNDPISMSNGIRRVLEEPGLAGKLSERARCRVEQYDTGKVIQQWQRLLDDIESAGQTSLI